MRLCVSDQWFFTFCGYALFASLGQNSYSTIAAQFVHSKFIWQKSDTICHLHLLYLAYTSQWTGNGECSKQPPNVLCFYYIFAEIGKRFLTLIISETYADVCWWWNLFADGTCTDILSGWSLWVSLEGSKSHHHVLTITIISVSELHIKTTVPEKKPVLWVFVWVFFSIAITSIFCSIYKDHIW